jgi:hypothetical protein
MLSQNGLMCLQHDEKRSVHKSMSVRGILGDKPVSGSIDISGETWTHSVTLLGSISGPNHN